MSFVRSKQLGYPLTGSFSGSFLGSASGSFSGSFFGNFSGIVSGSITNAISASYAYTASSAISSSYAYTASSAINSSASLIAVSASYAYTASSAIVASASLIATSASYTYTASSAISSSYAYTASSAINSSASLIATSASYAYTASSAILASASLIAVSASYAYTASSAIVASASLIATSASYAYTASSAIVASASLIATSASYAYTASSAIVASASLIAVSASYAYTASSAIQSYSASYAQTASFANNFTASNVVVTGTLTAQTLIVNTVSSSIIYSSGSNIFGNSTANNQTFTGSVNISGSLNLTGSATMNAGLIVSQSINAYNINVGYPTSNTWQSNLGGSYFNNFTSQTNTSEILRFIAGLLSASAPDASPNTRTFGSYTANAQNTTTGTVTAGSVPQSTSNATITYLQGKGFATTGSTIFSGIATIYTATNYGYTYTSVASGSTVATSSADTQLFGLGTLVNAVPTSFSVSGSFTFKFFNNSIKTITSSSVSSSLVTQTGAGTTSGVTLAKIATSNPAVIPAAYQDGKFASVFAPSIYQASTDYTSSGYYHISASIIIASGSSTYTIPSSSNAEIFYAPLTTISTNVPANTITALNSGTASISAVSRSLSGAPYLSGSIYSVSSSVTGAFNPLYFAGVNLAYQTVTGTGLAQTSGTTTISTAGGTIQTANGVYDSTGTTVRSIATIPFETDSVKLNGLYTFTATTNTNVAQIGLTPTTFTVTTNATNKNAAASTYDTQTIYYHSTGSFGQPATSGSLAYFGRGQGTDTATNGAASNSEPFLGENYRIQLNDNILSFSGTAWTTTYGVYNLSGSDLQVKPGYLVKPGGTYGYWLTDPDATKTFKYYVRKFTTNAATKTSMTINLGQVLTDWQTSGSNTIATLVMFQSSNNSIYTPARFYDPTKTTSNFVTNIAANTDGQNPFGSQIGLYGNTGGSLASTTYTMPLRNPDGMTLDATYTNIYVIVRYKGDPTPVSNITVTFA